MDFDSKEEEYIYWWLLELKEAGYITEIETHPESFMLSEDVKGIITVKLAEVRKTILAKHSYTCDFKVHWSAKASGIFYKDLSESSASALLFITSFNRNITYLEVKPLFDQNNMERLFKVNQKWMYNTHKVFVNKVIPVKLGKTTKSRGLFNNTFTPERYLLTDKGKQKRKLRFEPITLNQYLLNR